MTIYYPLLALTDCKMNDLEWPWWLFHVKSVFGQHFLTRSVWLSKIIAWKLTNTDPCCQRQKCRAMTLVSHNINYFYTFEGVSCKSVLSSNRARVVEIYVSVYLLHLPCLLEITSALIAHYDDTPFWISAALIRMTLNDLNCPIHS